MAKTRSESKSSTTKQSDNQGRRNARRFEQIGKSSAQIVQDAAALLDEEVAAGIVAAKKMQERFQKERRIDPSDFKDALQRFQGDAHEVINLLNQQVGQLRSEENAEVVTGLVNKSHDLLDLVVGLVNIGAELTNQLVQTTLPKQGRDEAKERPR
jgi:hypothetical protein